MSLQSLLFLFGAIGAVASCLSILKFFGMDWDALRLRLPALPKRGWLFAAIGLSFASLVLSGIGFYRSLHPESFSALNQEWKDYKFTTISDRTFLNERVPLDGYFYHHCHFENVIFEYNGTAPSMFIDNTVAGTYGLRSLNPPIDMDNKIWSVLFRTGNGPPKEIREPSER